MKIFCALGPLLRVGLLLAVFQAHYIENPTASPINTPETVNKTAVVNEVTIVNEMGVIEEVDKAINEEESTVNAVDVAKNDDITNNPPTVNTPILVNEVTIVDEMGVIEEVDIAINEQAAGEEVAVNAVDVAKNDDIAINPSTVNTPILVHEVTIVDEMGVIEEVDIAINEQAAGEEVAVNAVDVAKDDDIGINPPTVNTPILVNEDTIVDEMGLIEEVDIAINEQAADEEVAVNAVDVAKNDDIAINPPAVNTPILVNEDTIVDEMGVIEEVDIAINEQAAGEEVAVNAVDVTKDDDIDINPPTVNTPILVNKDTIVDEMGVIEEVDLANNDQVADEKATVNAVDLVKDDDVVTNDDSGNTNNDTANMENIGHIDEMANIEDNQNGVPSDNVIRNESLVLNNTSEEVDLEEDYESYELADYYGSIVVSLLTVQEKETAEEGDAFIGETIQEEHTGISVNTENNAIALENVSMEVSETKMEPVQSVMETENPNELVTLKNITNGEGVDGEEDYESYEEADYYGSVAVSLLTVHEKQTVEEGESFNEDTGISVALENALDTVNNNETVQEEGSAYKEETFEETSIINEPVDWLEITSEKGREFDEVTKCEEEVKSDEKAVGDEEMVISFQTVYGEKVGDKEIAVTLRIVNGGNTLTDDVIVNGESTLNGQEIEIVFDTVSSGETEISSKPVFDEETVTQLGIGVEEKSENSAVSKRQAMKRTVTDPEDTEDQRETVTPSNVLKLPENVCPVEEKIYITKPVPKAYRKALGICLDMPVLCSRAVFDKYVNGLLDIISQKFEMKILVEKCCPGFVRSADYSTCVESEEMQPTESYDDDWNGAHSRRSSLTTAKLIDSLAKKYGYDNEELNPNQFNLLAVERPQSKQDDNKQDNGVQDEDEEQNEEKEDDTVKEDEMEEEEDFIAAEQLEDFLFRRAITMFFARCFLFVGGALSIAMIFFNLCLILVTCKACRCRNPDEETIKELEDIVKRSSKSAEWVEVQSEIFSETSVGDSTGVEEVGDKHPGSAESANGPKKIMTWNEIKTLIVETLANCNIISAAQPKTNADPEPGDRKIPNGHCHVDIDIDDKPLPPVPERSHVTYDVDDIIAYHRDQIARGHFDEVSLYSGNDTEETELEDEKPDDHFTVVKNVRFSEFTPPIVPGKPQAHE